MFERLHAHRNVLVGAAALVLFAMGCSATDSTATTPVTGAFYTVTPDLHDSTSANAGSAVVVRVHVTHAGAAISAATVGWSVTAGHGVVSAATSTTDSLGAASVLWTLGDSTGTNTIIITSGDAVDSLHVIGTVGTPSYLVATSAASTTTTAGTPVSLSVRVNDRPGNPVAGATINWSATGGSLSAATTPSAAGGIATVSFSAAQAGTYFVTADLPGRASVIFQVVVQ